MKNKIKKLQEAVKAARFALQVAKNIECEASLLALNSSTFLDEETGERIVDPTHDYMMSEDDFDVYLKICHQYLKSRGIDCPDYRDAYVYPFEKALNAAEDALLDACSEVMGQKHKSLVEKARHHYKFRHDLIDLSLKLDVSTIPANNPA